LLNYNLALTCFNQKDYEGAENAAMNAIVAKPTHGSSHIILAACMNIKGERVKSLLATNYFLMVEPNSKRSGANYKILRNKLGKGVESKDGKSVNVTIPFNASKDSEFGVADISLSLMAATQYTEENKNKSDMELFVETTNKFFSIVGELKKDKKGFWWDLYVTKFYDLIQTKNDEAFCYYISQSEGSDAINKWIADNAGKMKEFKEWMDKK
jgi:hypothetical protein